MARRYYSSTAARTTLASGVDDTTTTLNVVAVSGWPASYPYTLVLDQDTVNEELVSVSARSGTTLTVTRGIDGTSAVAHDAGAAVNHGVSARDFDEPNAFINGTDFINPSIVTAKGDIIAATGNGAVDNVAVGSDGTVLVADSGSSTGVAWAGMESPNRNLLYNGAMQVAQRGTSATGITGGNYYTADRWQTAITTLGTWTQTVENDAPTGSGFRKSLKVLCTTADAAPAAADRLNIQQALEGQDLQRIAKGTSSAQAITLSFWVKSNVTGTYVIQMRDDDNTRMIGAQYTINASATWEKKVITFPADTTGAFDNDNAASFRIIYWLGAGSDRTSGTLMTSWGTSVGANEAVGQTNLAAATNNYWQVTGVQLEVGDTATPFEFKSYGQELRECQRYYQRITPGAVSRPMAFGNNINTTQQAVAIHFPVQMRTRPTALETTGTANQYQILQYGTGTFVCNAVPIFSDSETSLLLMTATTASGLSAGTPSSLRTDTTNGASAYLGWSAEL